MSKSKTPRRPEGDDCLDRLRQWQEAEQEEGAWPRHFLLRPDRRGYVCLLGRDEDEGFAVEAGACAPHPADAVRKALRRHASDCDRSGFEPAPETV